ncbi:Na-translocating system protein MpsC family protein [Planococcus sp. YIM B11945]|uniref:Na-translocating system protein MpsC family protein n=1 Tax=Planococcus sp. YIM B11945 TaxID=3435410 RepID=UPI003D7E18E5
MRNGRSSRTKIEQHISSILSEHFNNTSAFVKVAVEPPFILVHLSNFLLPTEEILLKRNEMKRLLETRDLLMEGLKTDLKTDLGEITGHAILEIYADWNLKKETGMLIAVMDGHEASATYKWPEDKSKQALRKQVIQLSKKTEKEPDEMEIYRVDDNAILIERTGTMVEIETQLIKNGATKELRLAKRPLDHQLLASLNAEAVLDQEISELFVDWDFKRDKSYIVLVLKAWME